MGLHIGGQRLEGVGPFPFVTNVWLNGFPFLKADFRGRNTSMSAAYENNWNNDMELRLEWMEVTTGKAYSDTVRISIDDLSAFTPARDHVTVTVEIGRNGELIVRTPQEVLLRTHNLESTPEMRVPIILYQNCAPMLPNLPENFTEFTDYDWDKWHGLTSERTEAYRDISTTCAAGEN
ncbi:MAG: hypothetical protein ACPGUX_04250 [Halocynthiibacter sp.]